MLMKLFLLNTNTWQELVMPQKCPLVQKVIFKHLLDCQRKKLLKDQMSKFGFGRNSWKYVHTEHRMSYYDKNTQDWDSSTSLSHSTLSENWVLMIKEAHINNTVQQVLPMASMNTEAWRETANLTWKKSNSFTEEVRPSWERNRGHLKRNKDMSKDLAMEKQTVNTRDCKWLGRLRLRGVILAAKENGSFYPDKRCWRVSKSCEDRERHRFEKC